MSENIQLTDDFRTDEPLAWLVKNYDDTMAEYETFVVESSARDYARLQESFARRAGEPQDWIVYPLYAGVPCDEFGPIYGTVPLLDSLQLGRTAMTQALPDRQDLQEVQRVNERVVAGYEILLWHYYRQCQIANTLADSLADYTGSTIPDELYKAEQRTVQSVEMAGWDAERVTAWLDSIPEAAAKGAGGST